MTIEFVGGPIDGQESSCPDEVEIIGVPTIICKACSQPMRELFYEREDDFGLDLDKKRFVLVGERILPQLQ